MPREGKVGTSSAGDDHPFLIISQLRRLHNGIFRRVWLRELRRGKAGHFCTRNVYVLIIFIPGKPHAASGGYISVNYARRRSIPPRYRAALNQPVFLAREKIDTCQP